MHPEEAHAQIVRPKRLVHPPAYLKDYDLTTVHRRAGSQLVSPHTTQHTQWLGDAAVNISSPSTRGTSPISQDPWDTVDEWSPIAEERDPFIQRMDNIGLQQPSATYAPVQSINSPQTSPYHRPWEEHQSTPLPSTSFPVQDRLLPHPGTASYHPHSMVTTSLLPPTYSKRCQTAYTTATSQGLQHPCPATKDGPLLSLNQKTSYPNLPKPGKNRAVEPQSEPSMLNLLGTMMGELQNMKDQILAAAPTRPQIDSVLCGERANHNSSSWQHSHRSNYPHYQRMAQSMPGLYEDTPVPHWHSRTLYESPRETLDYPKPQVHYQFPQASGPESAHRAPYSSNVNPARQETTYRGPVPTIPNFYNKDPSEFNRLKIALENLLPSDATELFRYQILLDHLKLEEARLVADSYLNSPFPYSDTMAALNERFGQPHKLALKKIAKVMDSPDIRRGDNEAFDNFALHIRALVGMLETLGDEGEAELRCGSHVERLLSKLPAEMRSGFRRQMYHRPGSVYNLREFSEWLQYEAWCQSSETQISYKSQRPERRRETKPTVRSATILHGADDTATKVLSAPGQVKPVKVEKPKVPPRAFCPYCDNEGHYLSQCPTFKSFDKQKMIEWIQTNHRCWRCGRAHQAAQCTLKKPCSICKGKHLQILHEVNTKSPREGSCLVSSTTETLYLDRPTDCRRVLLKVIRVLLRYGDKTLDTYAVMDDGSERTILLPDAAHELGIQGQAENIALRTIRQDVQTISGTTVTFHISPATQPQKIFKINAAFTAKRLGLADYSYPVSLLEKYKHLKGLPLQAFERVSPLLLIGADNTHLITPIAPVRIGPPGGPAAIKTRLGWTLQGPAKILETKLQPQQCLFLSLTPAELELKRDVERLWQLDVLPFRCEKQVTRSREDQQAIDLLETKTSRVEVNGILRYATPLLRRKDSPSFRAPKEAVLPSLRSLERRLTQNPEKAAVYNAEIEKLELNGAVTKLSAGTSTMAEETWYIPHHLVSHNSKDRIVFNCSYQYKGLNLNDSLMPGPTLSPSLLGVLLRFREHCVAISGDIRGMFHQVLLLPEDKPLLRFLWRGMRRDDSPDIYEWQVLPFGTTCSPCCASFALQRHVSSHSTADEDVRHSVERCFYVDNCLQSFPSAQEARQLLDKLRKLLASGGFDIRQWASNVQEVVSHLPPEARSPKLELWLSHNKEDPRESTLGLNWHCESDHLGFKHRPVTYSSLTMRNIYRVLASQYDPLGVILPFTTRAKVIVQQLWIKNRSWDDPQLPDDLQQAWKVWEAELQYLPLVALPRCYIPCSMDNSEVTREIHIFTDASEKAYGAVAYLRSEDPCGRIHLSFLLARSRVAPRKQCSIPRLELCAALIGAQLAKLAENELTLKIQKVTFWTDSTTVLHWLHSESCRFKVFVGTRVAEIQELTDLKAWHYVDSARNPADDLTRGKSLKDLAEPNRWTQGPKFLLQQQSTWPTPPDMHSFLLDDTTELKRSAFCGVINSAPQTADGSKFSSWKDLVEAVAQELHRAAGKSGSPSASDYQEAELTALRQVQMDNFAEDYQLLKSGKPVHSSSRLLCLSPEYDETNDLIRVGGRLRRVEGLDPNTVHPIVLDPSHPNTQLFIKDYDARLCHPGPERVFAELRRKVWILKGREAVRKHQRTCLECCKWRSKPASQKMVDLPPPRLRLFKPAFHSTGIDCFGPLLVKIGRRTEKRWGLLFKCLTTRAVHLEVLTSIDSDAFLMALRRFIGRRGKPAELYSDQGTNFRGGERELKEAFSQLSGDLQQQLAKQQISLHFNPPAAPHFGGVWEREIRSVKAALYTTLGSESVTEEVLRTVLIEIEAILNSKPLGYVSADIADADPITPNCFLMGRPDGSLPQVIYPVSELLGRRRWRHSQVLSDRFWTAFIKHYLPDMQARGKWQNPSVNIKPGTVVMLVDPQLPRSFWQIGRVSNVFPGVDSRVRTVEVQIKDKVYTRPISRLIVLPEIRDEGDENHTSD
ncbi:guanine nucleotide-binding protein G(I)/G(S)/G(O) subunit gamma-2 [Pimephales promelas]|nr:guanine nucleotide-binding protein G(I)/G(S)/G(O) subunit gamma-2 [Pimephales promelas]